MPPATRRLRKNGDVPAADSLLVFSCLLEVLELLQDLRVS